MAGITGFHVVTIAGIGNIHGFSLWIGFMHPECHFTVELES